MIYQVLYACWQAWRYRKALAEYTALAERQVATITMLNPGQLQQQGIKALVIGFDGVLAAHAMDAPITAAADWLRVCHAIFPNKIFILSNKPTLIRQQYFAQEFATVEFIICKYKKPFPHEIIKILRQHKLQPKEVLMLDDRLCTGILAAVITGIKGLLITEPYVDLKLHPIKERLLIFARALEKICFKNYA